LIRAAPGKETTLGRLQDRVALITGAASGMGRAAAKLFAAEGAKVLAFDKVDAVHETAGAITQAGGQAIALTGDAGLEADVERAVAAAVGEFGGLDICFANAGIIGGYAPFLEETAEQWQEVLRVNLIGPFLAIKHAARAMIPKGKGAIVCTASVAGIRGAGAGGAYSGSKAGVINLVQVASHELSGTGVRVNAICPGLIETGMTQDVFERARSRGTDHKIGQLAALKRAGQPEEIAAMALFLASDEASYVNGQAIAVDGGFSSSLPYLMRR
jgi:NAD(P)-dependent dehydrogenase (short-subunit alcohol dehydrogenase family)